jgi:hypothetical protein
MSACETLAVHAGEEPDLTTGALTRLQHGQRARDGKS